MAAKSPNLSFFDEKNLVLLTVYPKKNAKSYIGLIAIMRQEANVVNKAEFLALLKLSFVIAILIFFTAILYDFSVKMYYGSTNSFVQIVGSLVAVIVMTLVVLLLLLLMPGIRKAILRMFGLDEKER